jgi:simple sugar transport system permease protein
VAAGLANYFVVGILQNPESQSPETAPIQESLLLRAYDPLAKLFPNSPFNASFFLAIALCFASAWLLKFTRFGFQIRSLRANPLAARNFGIDVRKIQLLSLAFAGAVAGLVAVNEILGNSGQFRLGFSADFGFVGIAVALLARNNPLGVILSAMLFGLLLKGTGDLDIETEYITRDFSRILQAIIILSISVVSFMPDFLPNKRRPSD